MLQSRPRYHVSSVVLVLGATRNLASTAPLKPAAGFTHARMAADVGPHVLRNVVKAAASPLRASKPSSAFFCSSSSSPPFLPSSSSTTTTTTSRSHAVSSSSFSPSLPPRRLLSRSTSSTAKAATTIAAASATASASACISSPKALKSGSKTRARKEKPMWIPSCTRHFMQLVAKSARNARGERERYLVDNDDNTGMFAESADEPNGGKGYGLGSRTFDGGREISRGRNRRARGGRNNRPKPPIVFHPEYSIPWPEGHRFAMWKFQDLAEVLLEEGIVESPQEFVQPDMPPDEWILEVHERNYYFNFVDGTLDEAMLRRTGFAQRPDHNELVRRTKLEVAGTVLTAKLAMENGMALHVGGGTHHAHSDWGAGYTCLNDLAVAARYAQSYMAAEKVLILDCDVHQGDGTAEIFRTDPSVFTFSMHCDKNFPFGFNVAGLSYLGNDASDLDIGLPIGCDDCMYMEELQAHLPRVLNEFDPDLILYIGGVDVWEGDALGKLNVTEKGIYERDYYVSRLALERGVPIACVIGGGYDQNRKRLARRHSLVHRAAIHAWNNDNELLRA